MVHSRRMVRSCSPCLLYGCVGVWVKRSAPHTHTPIHWLSINRFPACCGRRKSRASGDARPSKQMAFTQERRSLGGCRGYFPAPILKTPVPQLGQVPFRAGRPFFMVICWGFLTSTFFL